MAKMSARVWNETEIPSWNWGVFLRLKADSAGLLVHFYGRAEMGHLSGGL